MTVNGQHIAGMVEVAYMPEFGNVGIYVRVNGGWTTQIGSVAFPIGDAGVMGARIDDTGEERFEVVPGDTVCIPPGTPHWRWKWRKNQPSC